MISQYAYMVYTTYYVFYNALIKSYMEFLIFIKMHVVYGNQRFYTLIKNNSF